MMGTRAELKGGAEFDAFNRYARSLYCYLHNTKALRKIKRGFWKRQRLETKISLRSEIE
jgi:hypothetical protein